MAIAILSLFCTSKKEKIIFSILLILSIIPGAIFIAYLLFARVLLETNSITSLFETNPEESKEFIADYLSPWVTVGILVYVAIPIVMICKMKAFKPLRIKEHKGLFLSSIAIIVIIFSSYHLSQSVYIFSFYKTFVHYKLRLKYEEKKINERQSIPYEVKTSEVDSIPQTIIVVIGESLTRNHMSLYGYPRNTNPLLSERKDNLYVYKDVVSPQVHTIPVIRSILTFSDYEGCGSFTEKPSLFELFNRAGYKTYFVSNQPFGGKFKTSYDVLLDLAQYKKDLSVNESSDNIALPNLLNSKKRDDGAVLPEIKRILDDDTINNKLIVVHLIGSHMAYKFRYPASFEIFNHNKDFLVKDAPYRNKEAKEVIDQYDNSVLYNDFLINRMIDILNRNKDMEASLIYFSDHGEELYDKRNFAGHAYEKISPYMCEVPFIVWVSDKYKELNPNVVYDITRPFSTSDFIYSISELAGFDYMDYNPERSLFSPVFKPSTRYVGDMTYEEVLKLK